MPAYLWQGPGAAVPVSLPFWSALKRPAAWLKSAWSVSVHPGGPPAAPNASRRLPKCHDGGPGGGSQCISAAPGSSQGYQCIPTGTHRDRALRLFNNCKLSYIYCSMDVLTEPYDSAQNTHKTVALCVSNTWLFDTGGDTECSVLSHSDYTSLHKLNIWPRDHSGLLRLRFGMMNTVSCQTSCLARCHHCVASPSPKLAPPAGHRTARNAGWQALLQAGSDCQMRRTPSMPASRKLGLSQPASRQLGLSVQGGPTSSTIAGLWLAAGGWQAH
jgi:hypothetical protein